MAILTASGVSFEFSNGHQIFQSLSFSLGEGLTALVGPNGVGKTTLARLITGQLELVSGSIRRNASITFLPQREEPPSLTAAEFLAEEYSWSALGEKLLAGISLEAPCAALSGGQWMRVRLTRALDEQFLILDEPTNNLDRAGREAVLQFLRSRSNALLISHDRECLSLCEDFLELSNKGLSKFSGGWEAYLEARERERENLTRALESAERKRDAAQAERAEKKARQEKRNRRGSATGEKGGMPKILLGGRKSRAQVTTGKVDVASLEQAGQSALDAQAALGDLKIDPVMYADLMGQELPTQKLVAETRDFNIHLGRWLYTRDLTFAWRGNIRLAIKGGNGSGKSTLLKAILGTEFESRGEVRRGKLTTLYVDQRCSLLEEEQSVYENVRMNSSLSESEIRNGLAKFLFAKEMAFQRVADLSGGERLRAVLAKGFLTAQKPELLVLDEPTNNLDLKNIEFLESFVNGFRGALLLVSHDEQFLGNCGVEEELQLGD